MAERAQQPIRDPWLPLPSKEGKDGATESSINFRAFEQYISLPPGERSLKRVAQDLNKSETLIERWSSKFGWRERALAWDKHAANIAAQARERQVREQAELWARRREEQRESDYELRQTLMKKTSQLLSLPMIERTVDASGKTTTRPARSAMTAVPALVRAAIKLGREVFREDGAASGSAMQEIDDFEVVPLSVAMEGQTL